MFNRKARFIVATLLACSSAWAADFSGLSRLEPGRVRAENGLWIEVPLERQFKSTKRVTVADIKGPGVITMIHFAYPHKQVAEPKNYQMNRDTLLQMYWDDETEPSVNVPMVDFFCDPAGTRERVNTALVNKRRGWNAYFPMPFRKSARVVLSYEGPEEPGEKLWAMMPCYSYVVYREVKEIPADEGYFHAQWRQAATLTGKEDYIALEATGRGKFVGWNVTVRRPGSDGYPVDMNEKFYIDGEAVPSVEFQGIEDSFGFSWGFPESENIFPLTGYWPFMKGAMAYRFFINDAISFDKSLKVTIGYGENEHPMFREQFGVPGTELQFSSTCYWYQLEPHAPFPPMPAPADRAPAPEKLFWLHGEQLPDKAALKAGGVKLHVLCGRPDEETYLAEPGFAAEVRQGYSFAGWPPPVYHCRADHNEVQIELSVPARAEGKLRMYIIDPDEFQGGRRQSMAVDGRDIGTFEKFRQGRWVETPVSADATADGKLLVTARNLTEKSNAVISIVEWVGR
ncbi:MAG TPA: DUF2961 domain-containing protein [Phycisphaerae bacterium]|nr:DUF2961 domain-containing protein [Phycisphaerae bacterium]HOJ74246.1 DUF2961 domain-containing protein [Phycisphaerae bacterium]HOM51325.1 DUF2961 domain-containing protein [Phycisphaerae bacterium]HON65132.1 DUF2961 domain-containing protein [Phycisphaerae bacterium]HOQ86969.1 DUF2961 domain-containing protein [Phycisphaerae bacterium]